MDDGAEMICALFKSEKFKAGCLLGFLFHRLDKRIFFDKEAGGLQV